MTVLQKEMKMKTEHAQKVEEIVKDNHRVIAKEANAVKE